MSDTLTEINGRLTLQQRLEALRETKLSQTLEKVEILGAMDGDDHGRVLPPQESREIVEYMGPSGEPVRDARIREFKPEDNHPGGGFFGAKACGENFRALLQVHPVYINPVSSMVGGYMVYFHSYREPSWKTEFDFSHLQAEQMRYGINSGIGGTQHFCPDVTIGLKLGWVGLLKKVQHYRKMNPQSSDFYDGLENILLGVQDWIRRHVETARQMARSEEDADLRKNLQEMAKISELLITDPPATFRQACQWIVWFQMIGRMYNGNGGIGQFDELLRPYYERDVEDGILTDEEAIFHIACVLVNDTQYFQRGGPDVDGRDMTSAVSFLILEAVHRLKIPANIGVRVHGGLDPDLLRRSVEIMFEDKTGFPKFLGDKGIVEGFVKNGYPVELARQRVYSGCNWYAIPGREYTLNDCVKINFACVFDVALRDMMSDPEVTPSVEELWISFAKHLRRAVEVTAQGLDFHMEHMHEVFPELVLDLLCHGPVEKGLDATHGGVEYYNLCIDGAALATVADSFAAVEQRVDNEGHLTWSELLSHLDNDFAEAEDVRLMLHNIPRFGSGGTRADQWAIRISQAFTRLAKDKPTPGGFNVIPGLFSWASMISMGQVVGATPNGRHAHAPISHGANPEPNFMKGGESPTALSTAVASVECGYGNAAPLQLDMDPILVEGEGGLANVEALIRGHFAMGGTMINMNVINRQQILEAHKDPSKYPNLVVRVTGFSAYFACLSEGLRQLVVDRIISN